MPTRSLTVEDTWLIAARPYRPRLDGTLLSATIGEQRVDSALVPLLLLDTLGTPLDTLGWQVFRYPGNGTRLYPADPIHVGSASSFVTIEQPEAAARARAELVVTVREIGAAKPVVRRYTYSPVAPDPAVVDRIAQQLQQICASQPWGNCAERDRELRRAVPRYLPLTNRAVLGRDGAMLLRILDQPRRDASASDPRRWILLAPDGTPRGILTLPAGVADMPHPPGNANVMTMVLNGNQLWVVERDDMQIPFVVRYRIEE